VPYRRIGSSDYTNRQRPRSEHGAGSEPSSVFAREWTVFCRHCRCSSWFYRADSFTVLLMLR
jgi:hypothetical protein